MFFKAAKQKTGSRPGDAKSAIRISCIKSSAGKQSADFLIFQVTFRETVIIV